MMQIRKTWKRAAVLFCMCVLLCSVNAEAKRYNRIAHRGYSAGAPENTLPSFRTAIKKRYDYIECDIQFTKDGVPVVIHDNTVDRTSNGKGKVSSYTYKKIRKLDFGSWKDKKYAGTKIPGFQEVLRLCKKTNTKMIIELKKGSGLTTKRLKQLDQMVRRMKMQKNVIWFSFEYQYLKSMRKIDSSAKLGFFCKERVDDAVLKKMKTLQTRKNRVMIGVHTYNITEEMLDKCKKYRIGLAARGVEDGKALEAVTPHYIAYITNGGV